MDAFPFFQIDGAKFIYNLSETPALKKYNVTFHKIPLPGCENYTLLSDEYWECQVRKLQRSNILCYKSCLK